MNYLYRIFNNSNINSNIEIVIINDVYDDDNNYLVPLRRTDDFNDLTRHNNISLDYDDNNLKVYNYILYDDDEYLVSLERTDNTSDLFDENDNDIKPEPVLLRRTDYEEDYIY